METKLTFATPDIDPPVLPSSLDSIDQVCPLSPLTSDGQPRTPISPRGSPFILDFADLIDSTVLMSPSPRPPPAHLPQTYSYTDQYQASVSQERSTVSPGQASNPPSASHYQPKADTVHQSMLPPLRTPDSAQPPYHYAYPSFGYPYQYPQYPPGYKSYGYTHAHSQLSYSYSHSPYASTSTGSSDLYTPNSATSYNYTTVQPSAAFGGWDQDASRRDSTTVSGTIVGGGDDSHPDRRPSASSLSERDDGRWDVKPSPAVSPGASSTSEMEPLHSAPLHAPPPVLPHQEIVAYREGTIMYTTDCEVKQTSELKRMCFNCAAKSPPSWRKSLLNPGRILCNKCGIFERTHNRARPPQNDDQKLRKAAPSAYRREIPPPLAVRHGAESPLLSPYSVPSQSTPPVSATMSHFTFPAQPHSQSMTAAATQLESSSLSSSSSSSSLLASANLARRHSQAHVHAHASRSPYAEAYARRGASYNTTPTLPSTRVVSGPHAPTVSPTTYWQASRRHSDAIVHAPLAHNSDTTSHQPPP